MFRFRWAVRGTGKCEEGIFQSL